LARVNKNPLHHVAALPVIVVFCTAGFSQTRQVTAADYAHAEKFMGYNTNQMVLRTGVRPNWLPDERFWYRVTTAVAADGSAEGASAEFILVDPVARTRQPAFDHAKLAVTLSAVAGEKYTADHLPFTEITFTDDAKSISFTAAGKRWRCDVTGAQCGPDPTPAPRGQRGGGRGGRGGAGFGPRNDAPSPDGKLVAFIRDYNLWIREADGGRGVEAGKETQLTTDGVKDYGYATDNAGWTESNRPILVWSPDSKKIATFQQDQRKVGDMYLVETKVGHPTLRQWKYPLPGDEDVSMIERVVISVEDRKVTRLQMPPDQHRSTLCDHVACRGGEWADLEWFPDSKSLAFVSTSRDHKDEKLRVADAASGTIREVFEEKVDTQFESGAGRVNWHVMPETNELIWFSERSGWGHLYLYDLTTGKVKNQITTGDWAVSQIMRVDEKNRTIYFTAVGRERGRDPYFAHFYRTGFDGKGLALLTPDDGTHDVTLSTSGKYFVDVYSKPEVPPVAALRDVQGRLLVALEKADISKLEATGWKPPVPIVLKGRDGVTDIYGLMFKPTNFDPGKKYPIVNHIYPGPQGGSVGSRAFSTARGDTQALAELGFIVVEIDGMGNPTRSKKFHDAYYANMGDNTLPDQVGGMKQLAAKYPWIDIDRAGIYGHSGGGFATADAMFRYPDFFKVGISEAGNHDNREYEDDWGERYQGLLVKNADGTTNYDDQANQNHAKNLKGKLLLAHGTMDNNVPPYNTLLVVNELIKANKDFDLLLLPNRNHGFGNEPYMVRRRWDYFVRWLLGAEPPKEYELHPPRGAGPGGGGPPL
jgi:dipeptidyl-peptidase-4